jgi:hypothetical protein
MLLIRFRTRLGMSRGAELGDCWVEGVVQYEIQEEHKHVKGHVGACGERFEALFGALIQVDSAAARPV